MLALNFTAGDRPSTEQGTINPTNVLVSNDDHHNRRFGWEGLVEVNAHAPLVVDPDQ